VRRFTQRKLHGVIPDGQSTKQKPEVHIRPLGQAWPQAPQCSGFDARNTHVSLPHRSRPAPVHPVLHRPAEHTSGGGQAFPHAPQCSTLLPRSTVAPAQVARRVAVTHRPFTHASPGTQPLPHRPQLRGSERVFTSHPLLASASQSA
jgi:hypothetical protein